MVAVSTERFLDVGYESGWLSKRTTAWDELQTPVPRIRCGKTSRRTPDNRRMSPALTDAAARIATSIFL